MSWGHVRARFLFREVNERGYDLPLASVTKDGGVEFRSDLDISVWNPGEDISHYKRVQPGDFVIGLRSFQSGLGYSPLEGLVSPAYTVLRSTRPSVHHSYFKHLFKSSWLISMLENVAQGIRQGRTIATEDFYDLVLPVPPLPTQLAIADFLDTETARIDALIAKKRCMIDLLRERVTSQIDRAFEVAAASGHLPRLSAVVHIAEGQADPRLEPYSALPLIAPNHIESGTGRLIHIESAAEQGAISGKYLCQPGDVVYSKIRPALRKVCVAPTLCLTSADMYPLRPIDALDPAFLFYFLLSQRFTDFAVMESERVAMPKINRDALGRIRIPLPPKTAQQRAVDQLDAARAQADALVVPLVDQVSLLREHRQALITAAVIGELVVPGVAA